MIDKPRAVQLVVIYYCVYSKAGSLSEEILNYIWQTLISSISSLTYNVLGETENTNRIYKLCFKLHNEHNFSIHLFHNLKKFHLNASLYLFKPFSNWRGINTFSREIWRLCKQNLILVFLVSGFKKWMLSDFIRREWKFT